MSVLARDLRSLRFGRYLLDRTLRRWRLTPGRVTLIYVLFGLSALYLSDVVLVSRVPEPFLGRLQALKGGAEVLLTGGLIYGLTAATDAQRELSQEKLERQREELHVLHRVLRHNLRNDLNIIMGMSEDLTRRDPTDDERRRNVILETGRKMLGYTEQAGRIRQVTADDGHSHEFDLVESLPRLVENHDLVDDSVDVSVELPDRAVVRANGMFLEALEELIQNAIEHNDRATPRLEVAVEPTAGPFHHVEITVSDDGPGIPDGVVTVLQQSESDQLAHLQGMGLWFVYWVVSESEGHLIIDENEVGGALVRVRVPSAGLGLPASVAKAIA